MRLLHTSDWHLGRTLHGVDLLDAQRAVLSQLARLVAAPADGVPIDAVLIAGDIYDRAVPPVESVALLAEVLTELTRHTTVIVTGGNHDSAVRLGFGSGLFTDRLHVRTGLDSVGVPVLIGPDGSLAVYPLPYLDPDHARLVLSDGEPLHRSHQAVLGAAMDQVRADLAIRPAGTRSVVMAHLFVSAAAASDSERPIAVGGVDSVRAESFDGVDYVALGHLHGPQSPVSPSETVLHYSGSPLRYSFSERTHTKSVAQVDIDADGTVTVTDVPLEQPRAMAELSGDLEQLLSDPAHEVHVEAWARITVTDRARPDRMFERVRSRFPHALQVMHLPPGLTPSAPGPATMATETRPDELAADFVRYVTSSDISPSEQALFVRAFERAVLAPDAA
jgi:exonuclease SbcD